MKNILRTLAVMGFVLMATSTFAEEPKEAPKKSEFWDKLPQEVKDKVMAINKKVKAGELTEEQAKAEKKALFAEAKKAQEAK